MIKKISLLLIIILLMAASAYSQPYDLTINVTDKMINKLLTAIGPISGEEEYTVMMIKGLCKWKIENPVIKLEPNKSWFEADVTVSSGNLTYTDRITGLVKVNYNQMKDRLELSLEHIYIDLKIKAFGKEKVIKTLDAVNYYKTPFYFDGPGKISEEFEFEMPDGSLKKIKTAVKNYDIQVLKGLIQMKANLDFVDAAKIKVVTKPTTTPQPSTSAVDEKDSKKKKKEKKKTQKTKK